MGILDFYQKLKEEKCNVTHHGSQEDRESEPSFTQKHQSFGNHNEPEDNEQNERQCSFPPKNSWVLTHITLLHPQKCASVSWGSGKEAQGQAAAVSRCSVQ